ncbi:protein RIK isoform X2 [Arachis duranensis]|uniref:Protein RIK n=1 Tax=Arachis duranensis TaxID=130453 RepID=A0A6P4D7R5_ARADU|nr:protein RIK isoform X2 [Arachis duranensis]XP_025696760.1 protein RIK isoform X2 [Arachis hypogaea]
MTEDSSVRVSSSDEANVPNDASHARQRKKKRKWDQPAESLVAVGMAVPGVIPLSTTATLGGGISYPGIAPVSGAVLTNPLVASVQQQTTIGAVQKPNQKIQDELIIAREIVINDAESSVRYKLTKRQTQEEIQRCTGAIVITRGKYRQPNAPADGEKPLYLHISAGAHIKETAERILAVDRAAAMIEEMLRQGPNSQLVPSSPPSILANGLKVFSESVFLGFDADPSLNIAARIRGPNDQYINHIMNETGATVILRGHGSGSDECSNGEDGQQPMHLFLSSNNAKSLEDAKLLAENLLDTISVECGVSRVSSCKVYSAVPQPQQVYSAVPPPQQVYSAVPPPQQVYSVVPPPQQNPTAISTPLVYSAVPPPQQLLAGVQSSTMGLEATTGLTTSSISSAVGSTPVTPASFVGVPGVATTALAPGATPYSAGYLSSGSQANSIGYTPPSVLGGTSYIGYGGIYPQATPLQQVALVLRHSPSIASTVAPTTSASNEESKSKSTTSSEVEKEKRPPQRRKFQELPVGSNGTRKFNQGLEHLKPNEQSADMAVRKVLTMPAPKKLIQPSSNGMPPPPPRKMPPPPPPPKFHDPPEVKVQDKSESFPKTKSDAVPDTLVKLMEYGDEDDDLDDSSEESLASSPRKVGAQKPFWAL